MKFHSFFFKAIYALLPALFFIACSPENPDNPPATTGTTGSEVKPKAHITPPDFNADSAYAFVKIQADMGPRVPGSKAHELCAKFITEKLKGYKADVIEQKGTVTTFDQKKWSLKNIIASINPAASSRIMLCTHWDSRPFSDYDSVVANRKKPCPGVNDGASGVGVLLEVARLMAAKQPGVGIDLVFFDIEDYGRGDVEGDYPPMEDDWCLGSQYWAQNPHKPGYYAKYGILLDMVGAKNATFMKEGQSMFYASGVVERVWNTAANLNYGQYFVRRQNGGITDDHLYVNKLANIPCIDIVHYDEERSKFFPHHHRTSDTIDNIDKNTLKAVGQTLLEVVYNEE
jgi:hypothetical protein